MLDLANHFLIAVPSMVDDDFEKTVIFIFDYGSNGAAGLVINRPSSSTIKLMFDRMDRPLRREDLHTQPVFNGGPSFTDRGFVLHEAQQTFEIGHGGLQTQTQASFYASTMVVPGGLEMTTSHDVLDALSSGAGPSKIFISLGYASWRTGQLEAELKNNDWLVSEARHELIFDLPPDQRYAAALALLGVDELTLATSGDAA